jgi:hypothetical protein
MFNIGTRLGLWRLTPLSTTFQLYRGGQFDWWRKPEYLEKTTDLSLVANKLSKKYCHKLHHFLILLIKILLKSDICLLQTNILRKINVALCEIY